MEEKAKQILLRGTEELGISLNVFQVKQFDMFLNNLKFFNRKINLTSITEDEDIVKKHFLDSLSIVKTGLIKPNQQIIDIGAGAGFPGLPLKIAIPGIELVLLESNNKKTLFLDIMTKKLSLQGVSIVNDRAELFGQGIGREKFDIALGRAISKLSVLIEYAIPLLRKDGYLLAMKSKTEEKEVQGAKKACEIINCEIEKTLDLKTPELDAKRTVHIIKKTWGTPKQYPRRPGMPAKKPLG